MSSHFSSLCGDNCELTRRWLDATFQGRTGFERMEIHEAALKWSNVRFRLVQELGDAWTLRLGPLSASEVSLALQAFVH